MELLVWDSSYSVGVEEIDKQHQKIFELVNKLIASIKSGHGESIINDVIKEMSNYTVFHFNSEEKYFMKFNYPHTEEHKKQHQFFINKVLKFETDYEQKKDLLLSDVKDFLSSWANGHIKEEDKKYGPYFNKHGLV